jgi:hypothetical protein
MSGLFLLLLLSMPAQASSKCLEALDGMLTREHVFLRTLTDPVILKGPNESAAIKRIGVMLEATGIPEAKLDHNQLILQLTPGKGGVRTYGKVDYIEFPNSTLLETADPRTGQPRHWLIARGVRQYSTKVDLKTGSISPQGYVSDVLMFEIKDGQAVFRSRLIQSLQKKNFFFEDPRISVLHGPDGAQRIILSGTDYSPHIEGATDPDVMNRYVLLDLDHRGVPRAPSTNVQGIPRFSNVSPFPKVLGGKILSIDAKNATFAYNDLGQVIVRTRLRPDFTFPEIREMAGDEHWKYAEQVFVFNSWEEMVQYDWNHCVEDLFGKKSPAGETRTRPLLAKTILKDSQIKELYTDPRIVPAKGKGLGPGTPPVRIARVGNRLFVSAGKNAKQQFAGTVPAEFLLKDGEAKYLTFDHEIRYFMDSRDGQDFLKRHYSLSIKQFDSTLTRVEAYYGDALQPREPHELGFKSGIADLQHVYAMGWQIVTGPDGIARVRLSLGVSDAHTEIVEVDLITLMKEMAPGSERRLSGQVY